MKVIDMMEERLKRQRLDPDKIFSEFMVGVESKIKERDGEEEGSEEEAAQDP